MKIDLHLHSHVSDGQLSPAALVAAAAEAGLDVIALTDHDTAAGVPDALEAARGLPVRVVPGIEVSTRSGAHEFHVLGYWIDPAAPSMRAHQEASVGRRAARMRGMVQKLREMGVPVTYEEVESAAGPEARSIGRPHLARALLAGGHTRYYGEAFARFISDTGPAFVAQDFPEPEEAIAMIHAAGGMAVWAHPPLDVVEAFLPRFVEWGLDGLECYRPSLLPLETELLLGLARASDLAPTGGSDWHGRYRSALGDFFVTPEQVREVLERLTG
jgi:predicted metal-dependent phosphoesterase TrpH